MSGRERALGDANPLVGTRVLVVDDHDLVAQSLVLMLRTQGLAAERSQPEVVLSHARDFQPAVVLLDLDLGDYGSAVPLVGPLTEVPTAVVMFTGVADRYRLAEAVEAGAVGIVSKGLPATDMLDAVAAAVSTGMALDPAERCSLMKLLRLARRQQQVAHRPFESLTRRERQVLEALGEGLTAAEIAEAQFVSVFTVRGHIRSVLAKLGVSSQLAAVAMARRANWPGG